VPEATAFELARPNGLAVALDVAELEARLEELPTAEAFEEAKAVPIANATAVAEAKAALEPMRAGMAEAEETASDDATEEVEGVYSSKAT
jgi:hypothetical protein